MRVWPVVPGLIVAAVGCGPGDTRLESAGRVAAVDSAVILVLTGGPDHPLHGVVGGALLGEGFAVANAGSREVQIYDMEGTLTRVVGRGGAGPGEFSVVTWMQEVGGHLFLYDGELNRVSEFTPEGEFVGSASLHAPKGYVGVRALGVFPDRTILVHASLRQNAAQGEPIMYRDTFALLRYDFQGRYRDSVGSSVWSEKYAERWGRGGQVYLDLPLGRRSALVVHGWHYYVVDNNDYGIAVHDTTGNKLRVLLPKEHPAQRLTSDNDRAVVRERLASRFPPGLNVRDLINRVPIPSTQPPYGWEGERALPMLTVGLDSSVWVLEFGGLQDERPAWTVLGQDGLTKGQVIAEEELEILAATATLVLVRRWDRFDAESVELRRINW
jgi:hypothetical protein